MAGGSASGEDVGVSWIRELGAVVKRMKGESREREEEVSR